MPSLPLAESQRYVPQQPPMELQISSQSSSGHLEASRCRFRWIWSSFSSIGCCDELQRFCVDIRQLTCFSNYRPAPPSPPSTTPPQDKPGHTPRTQRPLPLRFLPSLSSAFVVCPRRRASPRLAVSFPSGMQQFTRVFHISGRTTTRNQY